MIRVTRRYRFSASHRLHAPELTDAQNRDLYGKCNYPYGHGHNYVLDISVEGPLDERSGRAVRTDVLDKLVGERILQAFDHRNLNTDVNEFRDVAPTSENLGREIYRRLSREWRSVFPGEWPRLEKVRIAETARNIFEVSDETK